MTWCCDESDDGDDCDDGTGGGGCWEAKRPLEDEKQTEMKRVKPLQTRYVRMTTAGKHITTQTDDNRGSGPIPPE